MKYAVTVHRAPLKEGDTVYVTERKVRGKVLGRLKYLVLLELEGTHRLVKEHRGDLKLIHPVVRGAKDPISTNRTSPHTGIFPESVNSIVAS